MPSSPSDYIPQTSTDRRPLLIWAGVAAVATIIVGMIVGAPLASAGGHNAIAFGIYGVFGRLCHQIPERSFYIAGHQFAVCARCTGIYAGFAVATLGYPLLRSLGSTDTPPRRWLFLAAVPLVVDFSLGFFGVWENTHLSRFLTGALLSSVAVFYIVPGLVDLKLSELRRVLRWKRVEIR